jgi:uncharacterized protein YprB with RNaseH-like and TPR domain
MAIEKGSLIDFETTGRPRIDGEHEVVTLGFMEGNKVIITQRKRGVKPAFYKEVKHIMSKLPKPYFSYNAEFERSIISEELGLPASSGDFIDIMEPWKQKAHHHGLKWPKLDELIGEPEDYFKEHKIRGKDVPSIWRTYLETGNETLLTVIMEHCLSDILREAILLIRYQN